MEDFRIELRGEEAHKSIIKVIGVGGAGCNAVQHMYDQGIVGCNFAVCNTDSQHLNGCSIPEKIQIGQGLGAGTDPIKARNAALDSMDTLKKNILDGVTRMLFITAGMGGGTGTGATPVIAKMAHDAGILVVAVVTIPFDYEGREVKSRAISGLRELEHQVDSMLIINNQNLYKFYGEELVQNAFPKADEVLATAVRSIIEIITKEGYINVDFNDVQNLMRGSGMALMGCGEGIGENRIDDALKEAFHSPLVSDCDLKTARKVLINITLGYNSKGLTMKQMEELDKKIISYTGSENNFKRGLMWDKSKSWDDKIRVTVIAVGFKIGAILGDEVNSGNIICIDRNFEYEDSGSELTQTSFSQQLIGFTATAPGRRFQIDADNPPCLTTKSGNRILELENTPAIRRQN